MSKSIYTYCGVSTLKGVQKLRFANDAGRVKVLLRNGHTHINLVQMPAAGSTADAIAYLLTLDWARNLPCVQEGARAANLQVQQHNEQQLELDLQ